MYLYLKFTIRNNIKKWRLNSVRVNIIIKHKLQNKNSFVNFVTSCLSGVSSYLNHKTKHVSKNIDVSHIGYCSFSAK